mmetsp:Transcript_79876/g.258777  ORF Transcript_79876/g.258777 Transcript_79876/m.258777 type:complete len:117 (+) Transcript_79876:578-928(+)
MSPLKRLRMKTRELIYFQMHRSLAKCMRGRNSLGSNQDSLSHSIHSNRWSCSSSCSCSCSCSCSNSMFCSKCIRKYGDMSNRTSSSCRSCNINMHNSDMHSSSSSSKHCSSRCICR